MAIQATGVLLDGCVLSLLASEDAYGYSLTQQMKASLGVSESTLYPVMRRLQTDDCLTVYDQPHNGRNRRYYRITERGQERFRDCAAQWAEFKARVDEIILKEISHEIHPSIERGNSHETFPSTERGNDE